MTDYTKLAKEWKKTDEYKRYPDLDTVDGFATFLNERASREEYDLVADFEANLCDGKAEAGGMVSELEVVSWLNEKCNKPQPTKEQPVYNSMTGEVMYHKKVYTAPKPTEKPLKHEFVDRSYWGQPTPSKALEELVASKQGVRTGTLLKKLNEVIRYLKNR